MGVVMMVRLVVVDGLLMDKSAVSARRWQRLAEAVVVTAADALAATGEVTGAGVARSAVPAPKVIEAPGGIEAAEVIEVAEVVALDGRDVRVRVDVHLPGVGGNVVRQVAWVAQIDGAAPAGTHRVRIAAGEFGVWWYPDDPRLPGLARAVVAGGLGDLVPAGVDASDIEVMSMVPLHQAVVRIGGAAGGAGKPDGGVGTIVFVRVVPPDSVASVVDVLERCRTAGVVVPEVVAVDGTDGIIITAALPGVTLRDRLIGGGPLPDAGQLWAMVERLGEVDIVERSPATLLPSSIDRYTRRLLSVDGSPGTRIGALADRLRRFDACPRTAVIHGDLHDAQLLVDPHGAVAGVVDLEDLGIGDQLDDLGRLLAHVLMRGFVGEISEAKATAVTEAWLAGFAGHVDVDQLRHRTAVALLWLAPGPLRTGHPHGDRAMTRALEAAESLVAP
jgi:hypothetical protein